MKKVGKYVLLQELGQGQFGIVYKGMNQETNELFAIKAVDKALILKSEILAELFNSEMSIMSKIQHPNIIHLFEYMETKNNFYLVLTYCRDGDLEEHLKKHKYLKEDEAIYFLMQIMNGFKELHENRIMHRDVKLANIFLNGDTVLIGDFGFAKKDADVASTMLGTPMTMAPELFVEDSAKCIYTNKSDLWSIGICLFQLLYGKVPWRSTNMKDLKEEIVTCSGKSLLFPKTPFISSVCKDLLIKLLMPDPNDRIEWDEFFNHQIFALSESTETITDPEPLHPEEQIIETSLMFRPHEPKVKNMFDKNKMSKIQFEEPLEDPTKISIATKQIDILEQEYLQEQERIISSVEGVYRHRKKIIVMIMKTCKLLRDVSKLNDQLGKCCQGFMHASILLLKKGILLNEEAIYTIKKQKNRFNIPKFEKFLATETASKILSVLLTDQDIYTRMQSHLLLKLSSEFNMSNASSRLIIDLVTSKSSKLSDLLTGLKREIYFLVDYFIRRRDKMQHELSQKLIKALSTLYICYSSDTELEYSNNRIVFDWKIFEDSMDEKFMEAMIMKAAAMKDDVLGKGF